ncbi:hypothetical protein GM1_068_00040 [Gordonia malaquae NBRC 108250]|uniref:TetR family transcriptional regulator n=1 Tax=Gordonia malaquae NBRC 108250 TaxID=1223542 RepID=M3VCI7_GORML|nr:hypothetical protein GM1_068_00040 [Gordonia malaquae NBRC 108250]
MQGRCGKEGSLSAEQRVIDQYRQPFEAILQSSHAREELDDFDIELAMCQLLGPLVFRTKNRATKHRPARLRAHR